MTPSAHPLAADRRALILLALSLVLVALNLRPALSGVSPLLVAIRDATGLSAAGAGGLTTLPVLCFGLIAPFGPMIARRFSAERAIVFGLLLLAAGVSLRAFFGLPGLFGGTLLAGSSIGVVMVLLPGILKRDFADHVGFMTGLYTMSLCLGAALAAGVAVPLQHLAGGDWRFALAFWALPALLAALAWRGFGPQQQTHAPRMRTHIGGLWSSTLAWQVALHMGLQSVLAYCVFSWLPTILVDRGFAPLSAGAVLSASIAAQFVTALSGPWLATRGKDQRAVVAAMLSMTLAGLMGCMYAPVSQIWVWALVLGLGQGGSFSVATMLVVLRSPSAQVVVSLSGMAQLVGYCMAATGPFVVGLLRDMTGGWNAAAVFFIVIDLAALAVGLRAGRPLQVKAKEQAVP